MNNSKDVNARNKPHAVSQGPLQKFSAHGPKQLTKTSGTLSVQYNNLVAS